MALTPLIQTGFESYADGVAPNQHASLVSNGWTVSGNNIGVASSNPHGGAKSVASRGGAMQWDVSARTDRVIVVDVWLKRDSAAMGTGTKSGPSILIANTTLGSFSDAIRVTGNDLSSVATNDVRIEVNGVVLDTIVGVITDDVYQHWRVEVTLSTLLNTTTLNADGAIVVQLDGSTIYSQSGLEVAASDDGWSSLENRWTTAGFYGLTGWWDDVDASYGAVADVAKRLIWGWGQGGPLVIQTTGPVAVWSMDGAAHTVTAPGFYVFGPAFFDGDIDFSGATVTGLPAEDARTVTHPLGGSKSIAVTSSSYVNVPDWTYYVPKAGDITGATIEAVVEVRTENAGTSVTPKIRDITAGSDAVVGSACTATNADYSGTNQRQTLPFTPVAGHKYVLMIIGSNTSADIYGNGHIEEYY